MDRFKHVIRSGDYYHSIRNNQFTIYGTPTVNVTESTIYNIKLKLLEVTAHQRFFTGSIQINPTDTITLVSSATTASQSICYNETDNASNTIALPIEDVIYEIGGGAIGESLTVTYSANGGPSQINLPTGLGLSVTGTQVLISGSIVVSTTLQHQQSNIPIKL